MIGKMICSKIGRHFTSHLSRSATLRPNAVLSAHNHVDRSSAFSNDSAAYKLGFVRDYLTSIGADKKQEQKQQQQQLVSPSMFLRFDPLFANRRFFSSDSDVSKPQVKEDTRLSGGSGAASIQPNLINTLRPLSPHLPVYKPQLTSTVSIFNRISGVYLTAAVLVFYLLCLKTGSICFTYYSFYQFLFYSSNLIPISLELTALALVYHLYHSVRHFIKR